MQHDKGIIFITKHVILDTHPNDVVINIMFQSINKVIDTTTIPSPPVIGYTR